MRVRAALTFLVPSGIAALLAACLGSSLATMPEGSDASTPDAASGENEAASGEVEASTIPDTGTADAPASTDDAGALDASDAAAADASDAAVLDASDAAVPDASDAAVPDASDAAVPDASDAGSGVALEFDGVQDLVELPAADGGANEAAFSIELWFNSTNPTGTMFEVYGGGGADRFVYLGNGSVCFYVFGAAVTTVCSPAATYDDGAWHHVAGTLGAIGGTQIYLDGALSDSAAGTTSSVFNYDTNFRLGYGHTALNSALVYFGGKLDEVRVWSIERSASDILASYKAHIPGNTAGLQGYWKLDESGATTIAPDSTPFGHDGTLTSFTFAPSPWVTPGAF